MSDEMNLPWDVDGGPAFPVEWVTADGSSCIYRGMSLRDWFAGQALSALVRYDDGCFIPSYATDAYRIADAMLAERAKKESER